MDTHLQALNLIDDEWQPALAGAEAFRKFDAALDRKWAEVIRKGGIKAD